MNTLIIGPQGSGKGTQAKLLVERYGYFHLEMGRVLREIAKTNAKIRKIQAKGVLVPDVENFEIARDHLLKNNPSLDKIAFDGFPRSTKQYFLARDWLKENNSSYGKIILVDIPESETIERLTARRTCEKCGLVYNLITNPPPKKDECECGGKLVKRKDDNPKTIRARLAVYHKQTKPIIRLAKEDGIFEEVDGTQSIEKIHKEIIEILNLK